MLYLSYAPVKKVLLLLRFGDYQLTAGPLLHFFYHFIGGGTEFHILFMNMHITFQFLLLMGKSCTVSGPYFINGAHIGTQIQELAGCFLIQPVSVATPLLPQPFLLKSLFAHLQVGRNSFDILFCISGTHGFTAFAALQTVWFIPNSFFQCRQKSLQSRQELFFNTG